MTTPSVGGNPEPNDSTSIRKLDPTKFKRPRSDYRTEISMPGTDTRWLIDNLTQEQIKTLNDKLRESKDAARNYLEELKSNSETGKRPEQGI